MHIKKFMIVALLVAALWLLLITACQGQSQVDLPVPPLVREAPPPSAAESLTALTTASAPPRDLVALAERLGGRESPPRTVLEPILSQVGDVIEFWYLDHDAGQYEQTEARLVHQSDALNLWVEEGVQINESKLREAAVRLEEKILPTNRTFFGEEWRPGVDGDPRLNLLHLQNLGKGVVGFFVAADEFTTAVKSQSNERELLYASLRYAPIGSDGYYDLIAHEMQHMIHWNTDNNEATWLNEGMSVLAAFLNGYPSTDYEEAYAGNPDVQLNNFSYISPLTGAHYGAAFFLTAYLLEHYGEAATQALLRHPENGLAGIEAVLAELEQPSSFDALFSDWVVANYLDSLERGEGVYKYDSLQVPEVSTATTVRRFPSDATNAVHQYGADYIQIFSEQPVTIVFTGTQQTNLLDSMPFSGDYFWTTLPEDSSDMMLTRQFDLSEVEEATASFWTWYDIEENWDYAYVSVSPDGGHTWQLLETEAMTYDNPQGNSYGPAFTGISGGGQQPIWIQQVADLTPFAGKQILLRFEYITDDAAHTQGWAIDDISIPQLGFHDDVEEDEAMWQAAGFVRHTNVLPQSFIVQAILLGDEEVSVEQLPLDENLRGNWTLLLDADIDEVILIVSASTPFTSQRAAYQYQISR